MRPIKKIAIEIYVPAGKYCRGYSFECPLLMNGWAGYYCVLLPESFLWPTSGWIKKFNRCPSLFNKSNKLSEKDIINHKLRLFQKAAKNHEVDTLINEIDDEKGF